MKYLNTILPDLRFECRENCALCCRYKVTLLNSDIEKIERLGHRREEFCKGNTLLKRDGVCVFLSKNKRCQIYPARPFYCRTFPVIREMYPELEFTVDLSCPGIPPPANHTVSSRNMRKGYLPMNCSQQLGKGEQITESELNELLKEEDKLVNIRKKYLSAKKTIETIEKILQVRNQATSREEMKEKGKKYFKNLLLQLPLTEKSKKLLENYLVLWTRRQWAFRLADSMALNAVPPVERDKFYLDFLKEIGKKFLVLKEKYKIINRSLIWKTIQENDAKFRTRCTSSVINLDTNCSATLLGSLISEAEASHYMKT